MAGNDDRQELEYLIRLYLISCVNIFHILF